VAYIHQLMARAFSCIASFGCLKPIIQIQVLE